MSLSRVHGDSQHLHKLLDRMDKTIQSTIRVRVQNPESKACQLNRFAEASSVGTEFSISPVIDGRRYLLWTGSEEEVVLNIQGVLAEAQVLPVVQGRDPTTLVRTYQFVKIIGNGTDRQFPKAIQAIKNIHAFMARYSTGMNLEFEPHFMGETEIIRAENKLLSARSANKDERVTPAESIDPEGALRNAIEQGGHIYTEDNVVRFEEWKLNESRDITSCAIHPGTLRIGDVVDMGISFRLFTAGRNIRFQTRLDSVTVVNRNGEEIIAEIAQLERANRCKVDYHPPKKRRVTVGKVEYTNPGGTKSQK